MELENASKVSGERVWHVRSLLNRSLRSSHMIKSESSDTNSHFVVKLPIFEEHTSEIKGTESDLKNIGKGRNAGASIGAAFLKEFIEEDVAWAHLDIAGPAMYSERRGHVPKGGTGFGV